MEKYLSRDISKTQKGHHESVAIIKSHIKSSEFGAQGLVCCLEIHSLPGIKRRRDISSDDGERSLPH